MIPPAAARPLLGTLPFALGAGGRATAVLATERDCLRCQEGSFRSFFLMAWCANEIRVMGRMNWKEGRRRKQRSVFDFQCGKLSSTISLSTQAGDIQPP